MTRPMKAWRQSLVGIDKAKEMAVASIVLDITKTVEWANIVNPIDLWLKTMTMKT